MILEYIKHLAGRGLELLTFDFFTAQAYSTSTDSNARPHGRAFLVTRVSNIAVLIH